MAWVTVVKDVKGLPLNIMHVIASLGTGGAELALAGLVEVLGPESCTHHVVSLTKAESEETYVEKRLRTAGSRVSWLPQYHAPTWIRLLWTLRRAIESEKPDVVHGWMHHGNLAATVAMTKLTRVKHVWAVHQSFNGYSLESRAARVGIRLAAALSWQPKRIIYVSRVAARQYEAIGFRASKSVVIPNGIDCGRFHPDEATRNSLRHQLGIDLDAVVIGMVARWHPMKDHTTLLSACAAVLRKVPGVRVVLVGRNVDGGNPYIASIIESLGLERATILLGERHDMERLYNVFDVLALSSWGEAFPLVLCEAMASGVPCVTTDVGDSSWIVGSAGKSVSPRNPDALGSAILELIDLGRNGRKRLGSIARARIVDHFDINTIANRYLDIYKTTADE